MRWLLVGAAAVMLAGCGGGTSAPRGAPAAAPIVPDAPAPPIAGASRAAPDWLLGMLHPGQDSGSQQEYRFCFDLVSSDGSQQSDCTPTKEQLAQLEARRKAWQEAVEPAAGSAPRVAATLPLVGGGTASFAAWTAAGGKPCWATEVEVEVGGGGGGGGPDGPCARTAAGDAGASMPPCDALCLASSGGGSSEEDETYVLAGTVPADADALRVTLAGGATETYPLSGPLFPGFPDRRIFLLELGRSDWRTLQLVRGGSVARTVELPRYAAAAEDCRDQVGPAPRPTSFPSDQAATERLFAPYEAKMDACLRAAGALAQGSATVPSSQALPTTTP